MNEQTTPNPLSALALKLRRDPRYMAYALAAYQQQENLSDKELAETLSILPELIVRLALCRRPAASAPQFAEQVRELADFTLTDESQLAGILRQVDGLEKLAALPVTAPETEAQAETQFGLPLAGLLAAARDREEETDDQAQINEPPAAKNMADDE
ncbi:MAG: hypothetical protein DMF64_02980 [Acidobacteria bacterium]|nr:MAG: hypothetical protein DMF64_02980 [Acidobacteriota bacterium]